MAKNQITATRQCLYGGPLSRGKRYHFVAYLNGTQVATGETKDVAMAKAAETLLGAYDKQTASIYASPLPDGTICTTREYAPGEVEFSYHRGPDGRGSGVCLSRLRIDDKPVTAAEYHRHYVSQRIASDLAVEEI